MRVCTKCREEKPLSEFNVRTDKGREGQYFTQCKKCVWDRVRNNALKKDTNGVYEGPPKACVRCGEEKSRTEFFKYPYNKDGLHKHCKVCNAQQSKQFRKDNFEHRQRRRRVDSLYSTFGITLAQYYLLLESQNGVCKICGNAEVVNSPGTGELKNLAVDHCHQTNIIRGLLCARCNQGLGFFKDDIVRLEAAMRYLKGWA